MPLISILFWNLNKKPLHRSIASIANLYGVDVVILAECEMDPSEVLVALNPEHSKPRYFFAPSIECEKIVMFTRFPASFMPIVMEADRLSIRHLRTPEMQNGVLLASIHFPSKLHWDESDQAVESSQYSSMIRDAEDISGHQRTIVIGDLNMNPFDPGIINTNGFHAVQSQLIAMKRTRTVQKQSYAFFYNPMWNFFGDLSSGPSGTFYYPPKGHASLYWHMFDQVLLRPDLLSTLNADSVSILDSDGKDTLLNSNRQPDSTKYSDHLPILLRLEI